MSIDRKRVLALAMIVLTVICCAGGPPREGELIEVSPETHVQAGRELLREGRPAEAGGQFRAALALDGNYLPALEGLGLVALEEGRRSEAEDYFRQVLQLDPGYARIYVGLGRLEALRDNPQAAIEHYLRAIEMDDGLAEAHYHLARAYEQTGRYSLAEEYYKKTLDRDPNHSGAREDWKALADRRSPPGEMPAEYYLIVKKPVTSRGDMAALLARQLPLDALCRGDETAGRPKDISDHWAAEQIARVATCGLMPADQDTAFRPWQPVLRRDCARFSAGIIRRFTEVERTGPEPGETASLVADVPADDPDLEAIRTVISLGIMESGQDGSFRPEGEINGYRAGKIVQALNEMLKPDAEKRR